MTTERKDVVCYWHHGTYCEAVGDAAALVLPEGARVVSTTYDAGDWRVTMAADPIYPVDSTDPA